MILSLKRKSGEGSRSQGADSYETYDSRRVTVSQGKFLCLFRCSENRRWRSAAEGVELVIGFVVVGREVQVPGFHHLVQQRAALFQGHVGIAFVGAVLFGVGQGDELEALPPQGIQELREHDRFKAADVQQEN